VPKCSFVSVGCVLFLVICCSSSIASLGPSLFFFFLFTFTSFCSLFLRFHSAIPFTLSLFCALQMSLSHYFPLFISFQCSSPPSDSSFSSSSIHLLVLFLLHDVSFCFLLQLPTLSGLRHGHKMGSTCKTHYTFKFLPFSVAFSNFYYGFLYSSIFPVVLMVLLASQVQIVFVPLWERTLIKSQKEGFLEHTCLHMFYGHCFLSDSIPRFRQQRI